VQEIEETFSSTVERAVTEQPRTGLWGVYGQYTVYELVRSELGGTDLYIAHTRAPSGMLASDVKWYRPLEDTPYLFFRFARLADQEITRDRWIEWIHRYGVLGLQQTSETFTHGRLRGGLAETFSTFKEESRAANEILKLYEAARDPEKPNLVYIKKFARSKGITFEDNCRHRPLNAGALRNGALFMVRTRVRAKLREECFPDLYKTEEGNFALPWGFESLLGAMYLQLAFVMKGTTAARFCRAPACNKTIPLDAPQETPEEESERLFTKGKRKPQRPRSDKQFCGKACYMRWKRRNEKLDAARR
jgi:hypothetical protein